MFFIYYIFLNIINNYKCITKINITWQCDNDNNNVSYASNYKNACCNINSFVLVSQYIFFVIVWYQI